LEDGPPRFPQGSSCPAVLRIPLRASPAFAYRAFTSSGRLFQTVRLTCWLLLTRSCNPQHSARTQPLSGSVLFSQLLIERQLSAGFRLLPFRSPLLWESLLFSSPPGTEMVHFPGFARAALFCSDSRDQVFPGRVPPFGYPRIEACLRLPEAFRSLPRPSSPSCAKASTVCP
jgi:hypothetical protein